MCGIICIFNTLKLDLLQTIKNRGQESYGISYFNKNRIVLKNFLGKMPTKIPFNIDEFYKDSKENPIQYVIGHTRYSTSGKKLPECQTQPIMGITRIKNKVEPYILVHNGNISNRTRLKELYNCNISDIYSDTQILAEIINKFNKDSWNALFIELMTQIPGVYNLIIGTREKVFIIRDRYGVRPLCITKEPNTENYCVVSESNGTDYEIIRDIAPGELAILDKNGFKSEFIYDELEHKSIQSKSIQSKSIQSKQPNFTPCLFEYIYFCAKDTICDDVNITTFRYKCGQQLAKNDIEFVKSLMQTNYDQTNYNVIVVGAPETGITSAMGYSDYHNLNYHQVLFKKNQGRTFILDEANRKKEFTKKYGILESVVKDKIIIIVDDSLVRGNTLKTLIHQLKECKVKAIHIRIAAPPVISPCYFGIDIPTYKELIAYNFKGDITSINSEIGSDSLKYLKVEELLEVLPPKNKDSCVSCFTNEYNKELMDW